jgi:hypothetical protein
MCFFEWILQLFGRLKKHFVPIHPFAWVFGNLLLYFPLDNANMLRLCKVQCYNIYII